MARRELWEQLKLRFRAWTGMQLYDSVQVTALTRLSALATKTGFDDPIAFLEMLDDAPDRRQPVLDLIEMGMTWFLRDRAGIDELLRALAQTARKAEPVWVWSAGCASGEEPYTLAMALDSAGYAPRVLATDLNGELLDKARAARYSRQGIEHLPARWRTRYFVSAGKRSVRVSDRIRRRVEFALHNFLADPVPPRGWGKFDAVVCRNVLIYFGQEMAARAIERLSGACRPNGFFLLGAVERPFLWSGDVADDPAQGSELLRMRSEWNQPLRGDVSAHNGTAGPPSMLVQPVNRSHERGPTVQEALASIEEAAMSDERPDRVLARIRDVLKLDPLSAPAHLARGLTLWRSERIAEAADAFRMARCIDGTSWLAPYQLGRCLEELGEPRDASEAYLHALSVVEAGGRSGMSEMDERVEAMAQTAAEKCRAFIAWCRDVYGAQ